VNDPPRIAERSIALALMAALAFAPPLLVIVSGDDLLFGFSPLFLYLFLVWGGIIALGARASRNAASAEKAEAASGPGPQAGRS
jgi:hypothetical protein